MIITNESEKMLWANLEGQFMRLPVDYQKNKNCIDLPSRDFRCQTWQNYSFSTTIMHVVKTII